MVSVLERALAAARAAMEQSYTGRCDVYRYVQTPGGETREEAAARGVACRLSYETVRAGQPDGHGTALAGSVRLFTAPEAPIPAGAKVVVTQAGKTAAYFACSPAAVYATHAESVLAPAQEYA